MKRWRIGYAVRDISGKVYETGEYVSARNITAAIAIALEEIIKPKKALPDITDAVILSAVIKPDCKAFEDAE